MQDDNPAYADANISLALAIDQGMSEQAPTGWRGDDARYDEVNSQPDDINTAEAEQL